MGSYHSGSKGIADVLIDTPGHLTLNPSIEYQNMPKKKGVVKTLYQNAETCKPQRSLGGSVSPSKNQRISLDPQVRPTTFPNLSGTPRLQGFSGGFLPKRLSKQA